MSPLLQWPGVVVCALVIAGCICRVDLLRPRVHSDTWALMYILFATFAGGVLIDLVIERWVDWWACLGIAGVLLHLLVSRRQWAHGAPLEAEKGNS